MEAAEEDVALGLQEIRDSVALAAEVMVQLGIAMQTMELPIPVVAEEAPEMLMTWDQYIPAPAVQELS